MSKSIYSLVLSDDVVQAVDRLAYRQNTSRSNLINQILAEHLSLATPEMQMRNIFSAMEQLMNESFQIIQSSSASTRALRSQLPIKYKPTVRYQVELYTDDAEALGELKVSFRTQSAALLRLLDTFFEMWCTLEANCTAPRLGHDILWSRGPGWMNRELYLPGGRKNFSSDDAGNAIAAYVQLLDESLRLYFSLSDRTESEVRKAIGDLMYQTTFDPQFVLI